MKIDPQLFANPGSIERILLILTIVTAAHLGVRAVRLFMTHMTSSEITQRQAKLRTLAGLLASIDVCLCLR